MPEAEQMTLVRPREQSRLLPWALLTAEVSQAPPMTAIDVPEPERRSDYCYVLFLSDPDSVEHLAPWPDEESAIGSLEEAAVVSARWPEQTPVQFLLLSQQEERLMKLHRHVIATELMLATC